MSTKVIFIQGGGEGAHQADGKLAASLALELGTDHEVIYPEMPHEDDPDYAVWWPQIAKAVAASDDPVILVAHSVGGYIMLKYLSEEELPNTHITGICSIAVPYPWGDENWQYEGFSLPDNFGNKLPDGARIFLYHSRDDQTVPFAHMALYANKLPKAIVRETTGGHQLNNDLSVVAGDIKSL